MKTILLFFALFLSMFNMQSQDIEGTYSNKWIANSGEGIEYVLTLDKEGSFLFNYTRMYSDANANTNIEVEGTWFMDGHLLVLSTAKDDNDNKISKGLNLNKARFVSISPRNPKFNLAKPSLKFYESEVFYAKNMELIKTESTVTSLE